MKPSTDLFDLIQKMNTSERGFFIKYANSQNGSKNYILLFKALSKMKTYDREVLKKKLKNPTFLDDLHVTQNYLWNLLMKSLRLYREKHDIDLKLRNLIISTRILDEKGLYNRVLKTLEKGKELARVHHKYLTLLELLEMEATFVVARNVDDVLEATQKVYTEILEILQILEEEYTFKQLNHQLFICYRIEKQNAPHKYSDLFNQITTHPLLDKEKAPLSFYSKYLRLNIRCIQARIIGDRELAHQTYLKILKLWEDHEEIKKANPGRYKIQISNFLGNAITTGLTDEVKYYINELRMLGGKKLKERVETFQNVAYLESLFYLNTIQVETAKRYIVQIDEQLKKYERHLVPARATVLFHNFVITNFLLEDYDSAWDWVLKILANHDESPRQDIKSFAPVMQFIIQYEQKSHQYLPDLISKALQKTNQVIKGQEQKDLQKIYKREWLGRLRKLVKARNKAEKKEIFISLNDWLNSQKSHKPQYTCINELSFWVEARINNEPVKVVYERRMLEERRKNGLLPPSF